jgi:transketolase
MGVGMAYAEKLKGTDARVYVLCSDGELQSGSTWEAVMMAARLGLDNLYLVVDANGYGGLERITTGERAWSKLREFGWEARRCDGHDALDIRAALAMHSDYPKALIARTVKGKGASFMVDQPIWHYRSPNAAEYAQALEELDAQ